MCKICLASLHRGGVSFGVDHYPELCKLVPDRYWKCMIGMWRLLSHPFLKGRWPLSTDSLARELKVDKIRLKEFLEILKGHRIIDWVDQDKPHRGFHFTYNNHFVRFNDPKNTVMEIPDGI